MHVDLFQIDCILFSSGTKELPPTASRNFLMVLISSFGFATPKFQTLLLFAVFSASKLSILIWSPKLTRILQYFQWFSWHIIIWGKCPSELVESILSTCSGLPRVSKGCSKCQCFLNICKSQNRYFWVKILIKNPHFIGKIYEAAWSKFHRCRLCLNSDL